MPSIVATALHALCILCAAYTAHAGKAGALPRHAPGPGTPLPWPLGV